LSGKRQVYAVLRLTNGIVVEVTGIDGHGREAVVNLPEGRYLIPVFDSLEEAREQSEGGKYDILALEVGE